MGVMEKYMGTARMGYIGFRAPRHVSLKNRLFVAGTPQKLLIIFHEAS